MREIDIVIISDTHLGMYGCRAKELDVYLKSIKPKHLILNGDIIDMWEFDKKFFPKAHLRVLKRLINMSLQGSRVSYITGNHDDVLRKFVKIEMDNFELVNKIVLQLPDGKKLWAFHGDVFDASIQNSKWLAKLGSKGYDFLIRVNYLLNKILDKLGKERYSLSKKIKSSVKNAVKYIGDFEKTASELAIENGFDFVACGHIHQPQMREIKTNKGKTVYLNSGDWIENLSALEYHDGEWKLISFEVSDDEDDDDDDDDLEIEVNVEKLLKDITSQK